MLQAGDCVESFRDVTAPMIREKLKILLQMSAVLTFGATLPVIKVGRIAGQFAKPRTEPTEVVDGVEMLSFRGHIVHSDEPTVDARIPDPERLVHAYYQAASTLNLLRAFTKGGFADLTHVHTWNREFVASSPAGQRYEALAGEIERALRFMQAIGIDLTRTPSLHEVDVWTSHEGLLLEYEEALTRTDSLTGRPVRLLRAHALDRPAHARAQRRPRRVLLRGRQSGRSQARAGCDDRRCPRAGRTVEP